MSKKVPATLGFQIHPTPLPDFRSRVRGICTSTIWRSSNAYPHLVRRVPPQHFTACHIVRVDLGASTGLPDIECRPRPDVAISGPPSGPPLTVSLDRPPRSRIYVTSHMCQAGNPVSRRGVGAGGGPRGFRSHNHADARPWVQKLCEGPKKYRYKYQPPPPFPPTPPPMSGRESPLARGSRLGNGSSINFYGKTPCAKRDSETKGTCSLCAK